MSQYFPAHRAPGHAELGRNITLDEYWEALDAFEEAGLENGWKQEMEIGCRGIGRPVFSPSAPRR